MELTAGVVEESVAAYPSVQPLSTVEEEHVELLPGTFADGDYGWRDAEWVVQWYHRRFLGAVPNADRRAVEEAYGENSYEDVHAAIDAAVGAETAAEALDALTALSGVDVGVASAFLGFVDPDRWVAVGPRAWAVLAAAGELADDYPAPPSVAAYERYLNTCRDVAARCDCTLWDLYRTLWVLGEEQGFDP